MARSRNNQRSQKEEGDVLAIVTRRRLVTKTLVRDQLEQMLEYKEVSQDRFMKMEPKMRATFRAAGPWLHVCVNRLLDLGTAHVTAYGR